MRGAGGGVNPPKPIQRPVRGDKLGGSVVEDFAPGSDGALRDVQELWSDQYGDLSVAALRQHRAFSYTGLVRD